MTFSKSLHDLERIAFSLDGPGWAQKLIKSLDHVILIKIALAASIQLHKNRHDLLFLVKRDERIDKENPSRLL